MPGEKYLHLSALLTGQKGRIPQESSSRYKGRPSTVLFSTSKSLPSTHFVIKSDSALPETGHLSKLETRKLSRHPSASGLTNISGENQSYAEQYLTIDIGTSGFLCVFIRMFLYLSAYLRIKDQSTTERTKSHRRSSRATCGTLILTAAMMAMQQNLGHVSTPRPLKSTLECAFNRPER